MRAFLLPDWQRLAVLQQLDHFMGIALVCHLPRIDCVMYLAGDDAITEEIVTIPELVCASAAGGIYVQEPDAGAASVDALAALAADNPAYLPLGFAYGESAPSLLRSFFLVDPGCCW